MNIGLTGGIATGKSTVSRMLADRGALIIDADILAREIMEPGHPVLAAVVERFGKQMLREDGTLDRKKLGEHIFSDPVERAALNEITHPAIRRETKRRMEHYEQLYPDKLVVADIPLLFESGQTSMYEQIMVVYVPRELQLERLVQRDGISISQAEARLASQMDIERKKELADIVIDNSKGLHDTESQVMFFLESRDLL